MSAQPLPVPPEAPRRRAPARPAAAPDRPASRSKLALVPAPVRARRAPFVVLLLVLLAGSLVGLLLLNTASAQDSFRLHALQDQDAALQQQQQALTSMADGLDDPARLAARAAALGLEPGLPPVFLRRGQPIPKGAIRLGNLVYIPGAVPVPPPPVAPTAKPTVKPVAKKPVVKKPVAKKPVVKKPVVAPKVPVAKKSVAPVVKTPVAKTPVAARPTATSPTTTARTPVKSTTLPVAGGH